jgi:hypothetical protein
MRSVVSAFSVLTFSLAIQILSLMSPAAQTPSRRRPRARTRRACWAPCSSSGASQMQKHARANPRRREMTRVLLPPQLMAPAAAKPRSVAAAQRENFRAPCHARTGLFRHRFRATRSSRCPSSVSARTSSRRRKQPWSGSHSGEGPTRVTR